MPFIGTPILIENKRGTLGGYISLQKVEDIGGRRTLEKWHVVSTFLQIIYHHWGAPDPGIRQHT
jgi:hypothetical protein